MSNHPPARDYFGQIVENVQQGIIVFGRDHRYQSWNPFMERISGVPAGEVVGRHPVEVFPFLGGFGIDGLIDRALAGEAVTAPDVAYDVPATGRKGWCAVEFGPLRGAGGEITGVLAVVSEITERKRTEEAVRSSRRILEIVLNNIPQGVFWKDRESRYLGCNQVTARAFGLADPAQIVGRRDADLPGVTAGQAASWVAKDREVMGSDTPQHGVVEPATLADGTAVWLETSRVPVHDARGEVVGVLGTWQDVTARMQLEEQLRQAQKMEAVGQLAGGVAHDFNNLLTVINGYSDILLSAGAPDDPLRELVAAIRDAGETAASLTRQLLAFSRKQILKPRVVDLNDVVRDTEKLLRRLIGEDVLLAVIPDPSLGWVRVDAGMIEQVLLNLAVNARDAMPKGGTLTIETRNAEVAEGRLPFPDARPGPYVEVSVSDTGCGMTPEVKARIFEPFFTTKEPGKGTGLGLATAYGIVKQSEGHIRVESTPGRGTTFTVYLPAVGEWDPAAGGEGSGILPGGRETVLLVEDEAEVRRFARVALEKQGYRVLEAADGLQGLQIAEANAGVIDLLIADVVMPGASGRELAEILRQREAGLKVLYVSGYTDDAVVRHGVSESRDPFLQKPFTPRVLAKKVREVLDSGSNKLQIDN